MALCASAADAAKGNGGERADSLTGVTLQEVQVTSTRAGKKTPMAFTNLKRQDIKAVNFGRDVPYLLSLTPSVTVTSDAGNGIGYTTMRVRGTDITRINVTSNGIPMNDAESNSLFWVNVGDLASSVESIQIQRGVGTSTNGSGAFGATVNMQTENIGMKPFAGLDFAAGSYYSHKETVRFGTGLAAGHWGVQGRLSNIGSKGYLDRASTKLGSYFLQAGYFGDNTSVRLITFNGNEETYHAWNYTSKYEQSLYGRRYNSCGEYYDADGNVHYYENQNDVYHQQHYQLLWDRIINRNWNVGAALHYTRGDGYYEEYKTGRTWADYGLAADVPTDVIEKDGVVYVSSVEGDLVRRKNMGNDFYGAMAGVNYNSHDGMQAVLGGGWNRYEGSHFGNVLWAASPYKHYYDADGNMLADNGGNAVKDFVPGVRLMPGYEYYRNKARKTDFNIYGKLSYEFLKGLNVFIDLQYRHVGYKMQDPNDVSGSNPDGRYLINEKFNFFNPKFGLSCDITTGHRVYVSVAVAHKEPTRNDYEDNIGTELKAEQLADWEAGYKYMSRSFSAGANLYYMNYKDQFVLTGEINNIGEMIARNAGKSYRLGVELEAAWRPAGFFRWDINATFSRNRAEDWTVELDNGTSATLGDTPLSFSPDVMFNNILTFSYKGMRASLQSRYVGEQYLTNTGFKSYTCFNSDGTVQEVGIMLEDYFVTNINVEYTFTVRTLGMKDITVGCTVYNLFNKKYDNNGWAAPEYRTGGDGSVIAYCNDDLYEAGFAPQAPVNVMAHLSINF